MAFKKRVYAPKKAKARTGKQRLSGWKRMKRQSGQVARPLGNSITTKFRYSEYITINPPLGGLAGVHVFSANGLFDPDITGIGHQPSGFDQVMALFDHYCVLRSSIKVQCITGSATDPAVVGICVLDRTTTNADWRVYMESGLGQMKVVLPSTYGSDALKTVTQNVEIADYLGFPNPRNDDRARGDSSNNPNEQAFYHIFVSAGSLADLSAYELFVTIDYEAVLTEPKLAGIS